MICLLLSICCTVFVFWYLKKKQTTKSTAIIAVVISLVTIVTCLTDYFATCYYEKISVQQEQALNEEIFGEAEAIGELLKNDMPEIANDYNKLVLELKQVAIKILCIVVFCLVCCFLAGEIKGGLSNFKRWLLSFISNSDPVVSVFMILDIFISGYSCVSSVSTIQSIMEMKL